MNIDLTNQEIDYVLQVLTQRPLGEALPLFEKVRGQVQAAQQQQAASVHEIHRTTARVVGEEKAPA